MNVLFIGYWSVNDPLTTSTIIPHLKILEEMDEVKKVMFVTPESPANKIIFEHAFQKVEHHILPMKNNFPALIARLLDFLLFPKIITKLCRKNKVDKIIARSSLAGAMAWMVHQKLKIPFAVESFEPHAEYMLESGVWTSYDPRYIFQKYWERKQQQHAQLLMPVASGYKNFLIENGINPERIITVPCSVDAKRFQFNKENKMKFREELKLPAKCIAGIYVGKFGGLYYREEAIRLFKAAFDYLEDFRLIILTAQVEEATFLCQKYGLPSAAITINKAKYEAIPHYLAAADFAYATYQYSPSKKYLNPVKVGEYWAAGLPIIITKGTGDDASIIEEKRAGAIYDPDLPEYQYMYMQIGGLLEETGIRKRISQLAVDYRNINACRYAYRRFLVEQS